MDLECNAVLLDPDEEAEALRGFRPLPSPYADAVNHNEQRWTEPVGKVRRAHG